MSSSIRRVRRDVRPTLPTVSTSKSAPRLNSSSSKNGHSHHRNNTSSSKSYENDKDKRKKPLSRTVAPLREQDREISIECMDEFNDKRHAKDAMKLQSSILNLNNRNSIDEIRKQHKISLIAKGLFMFMVTLLFATRILEFMQRSPSENFIHRKGIASIITKEQSNENTWESELRRTEKENGAFNIVSSDTSKAFIKKILKKTADILIEKNVEKIESNSQEDKESTKKESFPKPNSDLVVPTVTKSNTKKVNSKDKAKLRTNAGKKNPPKKDLTNIESPKLSGGVSGSFSVKTLPDIPEPLGNFADYASKVNLENDMPFFWDIHLGGGTVVEHVFGKCLKLLQASEMGTQHNINNARFDESLQELEISGEKYLNIDTTTVAGLEHAKSLNIINSPLSPAVIFTPLVHELGSIFTPQKRGRMFTLFRHPVKRAVGMYFYLQYATWDPLYDPQISDMNIEEYASSPFMENNWMTRFLLDKKGGRLTKDDLTTAKEILRRKCLVGLFDKMQESLIRFELYFGWRRNMGSKEKKCESELIKNGDERHEHIMVDEGSKAWSALLKQNMFDMELYLYAENLFEEQGRGFVPKSASSV